MYNSQVENVRHKSDFISSIFVFFILRSVVYVISVNTTPALANASPAMGSVKVTSASPQVRTTSQVQLPTTPLLARAKPVMRVSPLVTEQKANPVCTTTVQQGTMSDNDN